MAGPTSDNIPVFVGTYTSGKSEGIYVYRLDLNSGALTFASKATGLKNPSFLTLHPQQTYLYAASEVGEFAGQNCGAVCAFAIHEQTGELTLLNQQPTHGADPCHLSVDQTGRVVVVANYAGGSVCVLPIQPDGRLGEATDHIRHQGSSVNPARQAAPHPHSVFLDPGNRFTFVPDLGLDKIMIYQLELSHGKLKPSHPPSVSVKPGAGPRHFDFHPGGQFAYVINELDSTFTAFAYEGATGTLKEIQSVSTLPEGFKGSSHCADVHVSPSGRFLYGSNRGHDSIVIYAIDEATGRLTFVGHEPTQGKTPRNFAIDPTGTYLLAANQDTDTIVTFRIDPQTGKLSATGHVTEVPAPVCLKLRQ
jgi:6-phosphogluconolactonase